MTFRFDVLVRSSDRYQTDTESKVKHRCWFSGWELPDRYQTDTEFKVKTHVAWITGWVLLDLLLWVSDLRFWIGASRPISNRQGIQSKHCCCLDYWAAGNDQTLCYDLQILFKVKAHVAWIPGKQLLDWLLWSSDLRFWVGDSGPMVLGREILGEKLVTWSDRYETDVGPISK